MIVEGPVRVSRFAGANYVVRTAWSDALDLRQKVALANVVTWNVPAETGIGLVTTDLIPMATTDAAANTAAAVLMPHGTSHSDDFAPIRINNTYIGAGHGLSSCVKVTSTGHGKTAVDVGSEWLNGSGHKWYIVRVLDTNNLLMLSEDIGSGDIWAFRAWSASATLTHSDGATNTGSITVTGTTLTQYLWPSYRHLFKQCIVDGRTVIQNDGHYACEFADFVEIYEIFNPASVLAYLIANRGSDPAPDWSRGSDVGIAVQAVVSNTYRYHRNGSCTIYWRQTATTTANVGVYGVVQAGALATPASGSVLSFIPGSKPFIIGENNYDFVTGHPLANILNAVSLTPDRWASAVPPHRFISIRQASDGSRDYGHAIGYWPFESAAPATRKDRIDTAFGYPSTATKKSYPRLQGGNSTDYPAGTVPAGAEFTAVGFRVPFQPGEGQPIYACWYQVGVDAYAMIECQSAYGGDVVIDAAFAGRAVSVVESQGAIVAGTRATATGAVRIDTTGYGSIVLKLAGGAADQLAADAADLLAASNQIAGTITLAGQSVSGTLLRHIGHPFPGY